MFPYLPSTYISDETQLPDKPPSNQGGLCSILLSIFSYVSCVMVTLNGWLHGFGSPQLAIYLLGIRNLVKLPPKYVHIGCSLRAPTATSSEVRLYP